MTFICCTLRRKTEGSPFRKLKHLSSNNDVADRHSRDISPRDADGQP